MYNGKIVVYTSGTFDMFQKQLKKIRYRNSLKKQLLYTDRLHYTSDWIFSYDSYGISRICGDKFSYKATLEIKSRCRRNIKWEFECSF